MKDELPTEVYFFDIETEQLKKMTVTKQNWENTHQTLPENSSNQIKIKHLSNNTEVKQV